MYALHIFRDGALPVVPQRFHQTAVRLLRCSYWVLQLWNHANLVSPYWRLYWNAEPGAEVHLQGACYPLGPDHLVLIAPATRFTTRFSGTGEDTGGENVMLGCPAAQWTRTPRRGERLVHHFFAHFLAGPPYDGIGPHVITVPIDAQMRGLLRALTEVLAHDPPVIDYQQSLTLLTLIHLALSMVPEAHWPTPQTDERVVAVIRHIEKHYHRKLTNADFARLSSMSAKAFTRLFKEKTHQTPLDYLRQQRLAHASILLHHTDESIERIAERCGFFDRHHFTKTFQRAFNVGPATYRKTRLL